MPPASCIHPLCDGHAVKNGRCKEHKHKYTGPLHNSEQAKSNNTFYNSSAWRKVRHSVLMKEPLCVECKRNDILTEGVVVDHIIRRSHYNGHDCDVSNLQVLCSECHNRKTQKEQVFYDNGTYADESINPYIRAMVNI